MATTYDRIYTALLQAEKEDSWENTASLAAHIRNSRLKAFKLRGEGRAIENFMSVRSIEKLLNLMVDLDLLTRGNTNEISISAKGTRSLTSKKDFDRQIRSSVKSWLQNHNLPLTEIIDVIDSVELPDVPNLPTLHRLLTDQGHTITEADLRKILFLYATAAGIDRIMTVFYKVE